MAQKPPSDTALRVAALSQTAENAFSLRPGSDELEQIAADLGLSALRKLSFTGTIAPLNDHDWLLSGTLGATVVQSCVVTLDPVTTRIDQPVTRSYLRDYVDPDDPEIEMPEDETEERLTAWIDPGSVMIEALTLAAPDYPRKNDAALGQLIYTEPGKTPMSDEDAKPFAGLADLKSKLESGKD